MAQWLKQSTATTIKMGPFVDDTDGKTAETALTLSQADFRVSKNGGDFAQKNDATSATHDELGYYDVPLSATDTNTLGLMTICVTESGALPVWAEFMIVPANVWDSLFGTDLLQVDSTQQGGTNLTASDIGAVVAAIKAKTDNLPTDPADESLIEAAIAAATSPLATSSALAAVAGYIDTEVAAIKAKTDNLPLDPASMADVQTALDALASPENITVNAVVAISAIEAEQLQSGELAIKMHYATRQSIHSTIMYDLSTATKLWIACKRRVSIQTTDDKSLFFVEQTDGLVYLDKEIYATPEHGSLTVTGEPGNWNIVFYLHQDAASLLGQYVGDDCVMEIKALVPETVDPVYITGGRCEFSVGVVQAVE